MKRSSLFIVSLALLFGGAIISYAALGNPSENPPLNNRSAPINNAILPQVKSGALEVNAGQNELVGFAVEGHLPGDLYPGSPSTGKMLLFGAPPSPLPPASHWEKLYVDGSIRIDGVIVPNNHQGAVNEVLTRVQNAGIAGMDWAARDGWMAIAGRFSPDSICSGPKPRPCAAFQDTQGVPYADYALYCIGEDGYSFPVRICEKPF